MRALPHARPAEHRLRSPLGVALAFVAAALLGCGEPRPNLLLLVSDALRADALSCYGGAARTPNLCRLAGQGVRFEHAFAAAPWTLPSAVALFTGNAPGQYRAVAAGNAEPALAGGFYRVPEGELLLAEALREAGWRVEAGVENPIAAQAGALQGFTRRSYGRGRNQRLLASLDPGLGFTPRDGRYFRSLWLLDALASAGGEPFALLHWFDDPHAEYRPPPGLLEEATVPDLPREVEFYLGLGHHDRPRRGRHKLRDHGSSLTSDEVAFLKRLYLLEVESVDERVGFVLEALARSGQAGRTLVVFTADHGEGFGEHGDFLHGVSLHQELVRVPLIMAGPGVARGRVVDTPVSHLDVVPTLAELLGVGGLAPVQGESLRHLLAGGARRAEPRALYLSSPDRLDHDAVVAGRYKLIAGPGGSALFDFVADPGETRDLAPERPEVRRALEARLPALRAEVERRRLARLAGEDPAALERAFRETERALRAVGYLD